MKIKTLISTFIISILIFSSSACKSTDTSHLKNNSVPESHSAETKPQTSIENDTATENIESEDDNTSTSSDVPATESTIPPTATESTPLQNNPPYFNNTQNFADLIKAWDNYINIGCCCELEDVSENMYMYLTEYQQSWYSGIEKIKCCNTINEAKAHLESFIDASLCKNFDERNFLVHNGELYIVKGAKGYISHDYENIEILPSTDENLHITSALYSSGGNYCEKDRFVLKNVNNNYTICNMIKGE